MSWRFTLLAAGSCLWAATAVPTDLQLRASSKASSAQAVLQPDAADSHVSLRPGAEMIQLGTVATLHTQLHALAAMLHQWLHTLSVAAVVTTIGLQLSPMPSSLEIQRDRDVKRYDGYPYFSVLAGATQWCIYGSYAAYTSGDVNLLTMVAANFPGVLFGIFYVSNFFSFVPADDTRRMALMRYLGLFSGVLLAELASVLAMGPAAVFWMGLLGSVGSAQIALSPFKTLPEVIRTRSTRSWPLDLCLWNMIQSLATGGFGAANDDPWVWVPNVIGVIAAAIQLTLVTAFWEPDKHDKRKVDGIKVEPARLRGVSMLFR